LSYPQPQQLVRVEDDLPGAGAEDAGMSEPEWKDAQALGQHIHLYLGSFEPRGSEKELERV
jgi:hypothetical protein